MGIYILIAIEIYVFHPTYAKDNSVKFINDLTLNVDDSSFDEEILHISGSLLPNHTGSVSWLDKPAEEAHTERLFY